VHPLCSLGAVLGSTWRDKTVRLIMGLALVLVLAPHSTASAEGALTAPEEPETLQVPDFYIFCRLATRTELVGSYSSNVATLGSDTVIPMETLIAGAGFISLQGYIAEARNSSTVKSERDVLTTLSESVLLSQPSLNGPKLLGLVRPSQAFRILASIKGPDGGEPALFHKVEIKGRLLDPVFNQCSANSGY
jgi:hypothetical protein